jgi:hypothetical protein
MSGNSKDRRLVRRLIESILNSQTEKSPPAHHQLLSFASVGFAIAGLWAIGGILMTTPAPIWISDTLFALGFLIAVVRVLTWKALREESKFIQFGVSISLICLISFFTQLLIFFNHKNPPYSFPWVRTAYEEGDSVGIQVCVREYPVESDLHSSTLTQFGMSISAIKNVTRNTKNPSWAGELIVAPIKAEKWANEDCKSPLVWVPVTKPVVLEFEGSSDGGNWNGYVILSRENGHLHRYESMSGWISFPRSKAHFTRTEELTMNDKGQLAKYITEKWNPLTRQRLIELGIPET